MSECPNVQGLSSVARRRGDGEARRAMLRRPRRKARARATRRDEDDDLDLDLDLDRGAVRVRPAPRASEDDEESARARRAWTLRGDEGGATRDGRRTATGGRERANDGTRTRYRGFLAKMESTKMDAEALREKLVAVREKTQEAMKKIEVPKVEDLRMLIEDIRQEQTEAKYHPDRRRLESVADFFAYTEEEGDSRNRIESKRARGDATLTLPMTDW
jgi:hypothetical protein